MKCFFYSKFPINGVLDIHHKGVANIVYSPVFTSLELHIYNPRVYTHIEIMYDDEMIVYTHSLLISDCIA